MKKYLIFIMVIFSFVFAVSCSFRKKGEVYEIALITEGEIDDKSYNQGAWEGLLQYADNNDKTYKYYRASAKTTESYIEVIDLAVYNGAKLIITPNYLFETAVYKAQDKYPKVTFIIIDGIPQDGTYSDSRIENNTYSILYAEEQAGFLAGYAITKEGYTNLGVMGGMEVPPVLRFGYGFLQGVNYAAKEMNLSPRDVEVNYTYVNSFEASYKSKVLADSWYKSGVQVIFAPAGGVVNSVIDSAEENNGWVIGVDVDQSFESPTVITSAIKKIKESVYNAVDSFYNGSFVGGKKIVLDVKVNGVGLTIRTSHFQQFTENDYNIVYQKLVDGSITVLKDTDVRSLGDLPLDIVKVNYIK
ncbi:BMP family ABC transporter substrate-binding protein [Brachyspira sp.]|uniref:BMP family lipoprotein n=1 Tax=Brachyspira sp. TaxID=1977261 RepID=UPI002631793E|nr:BMP family ABC transporter substrate-binding protein [Brachyspira sp.]